MEADTLIFVEDLLFMLNVSSKTWSQHRQRI